MGCQVTSGAHTVTPLFRVLVGKAPGLRVVNRSTIVISRTTVTEREAAFGAFRSIASSDGTGCSGLGITTSSMQDWRAQMKARDSGKTHDDGLQTSVRRIAATLDAFQGQDCECLAELIF